MGLFKAISSTAAPVAVELLNDEVPTFRSRRSKPNPCDVNPHMSIEEEEVEYEHSGSLFDAFSERLISLRNAQGKIG